MVLSFTCTIYHLYKYTVYRVQKNLCSRSISITSQKHSTLVSSTKLCRQECEAEKIQPYYLTRYLEMKPITQAVFSEARH